MDIASASRIAYLHRSSGFTMVLHALAWLHFTCGGDFKNLTDDNAAAEHRFSLEHV
jgi:hypothetical protein